MPSRLLDWPLSVMVDELINLSHQPDGLGEGDDDFVAVGNVVLRTLAAFEPILADLIWGRFHGLKGIREARRAFIVSIDVWTSGRVRPTPPSCERRFKT